MPVQAILFDHDGTLVDSEPLHFAMWQAVLAAHGIAFTEQQYKDHHAGMPTAANAAELVFRLALKATPAEVAEAKNEATRRFLAEAAYPLMPGAQRAVAQLRHRGLRLAVVTGAGSNGVQATVRDHAMDGIFETVVSGDDVQHSKPAPDCYLLAMQRLGLQPADCIAIEDTVHGVNAAAAAGIVCLAVPTDMSRHHDFSKASAVLGGLDEAVEWIAQHARQ